MILLQIKTMESHTENIEAKIELKLEAEHSENEEVSDDKIYSEIIERIYESSYIINSSKLREVPELNNCMEAFDVLESSVNLLKKNFMSYQHTCIESGGDNSLFRLFIDDVSKSQKTNPNIIQQFRQITNYMAKKATNNNDSKINKIFKMLNVQFGKIEQSETNSESIEKSIEK